MASPTPSRSYVACPAGEERPSRRPGATSRLVFIDPGVADATRLLAALEPGVRGWLLDPGQDGLVQVAAVAERHAGLHGIAIVAHGNPGMLALGTGVLSHATLPAHAASLRAIGRAIAPGGSLAVYACEFGRDAGAALVGRMAQAAGVGVAASSGLVGGGRAESWVLHGSAGVVAPPLRASALAAYAPTLSGATTPAGFPIGISNFNTISNGATVFTSGSAAVTASGQLQLTPDADGQHGIAVYDQPFASTEGLIFDFTYVSAGGGGADGIVFFLLDGDSLGGAISSTSVTAGYVGASIGYSDGGGNPGITDGFLGIGFDTYGNYDTTVAGGASADDTVQMPNTIGVRGAGNGTTGYDYLGGTTYASGIDGTHAVRIDLVPEGSGAESLTVYEAATATGPLVEAYSTTVSQGVPGSLYFGFSSGTGSVDDLHEITGVAVTVPVDLRLGQATVRDSTTGSSVGAAGTLAPGDSFTYTYTLTDAGANGDAGIIVNDALPGNIEAGTWTVTDSTGTHAGSGAAIAVSLLAGATATIVVGGTVNPDASSGNANHLVTVSPGSAYTLGDPTLDAPVTLAIGGGGGSVSLVSANAAASTGDTAAVTPLAAAQVVDTFTNPATGLAPVDRLTVSVAPAAGVLAAPGGTYTAATGVLTATGTAAQLQAVLDSLAFTPAAHATLPGSVTPVTLRTTVTDPDPADTVGGASATQTATISVTAAHDQPSVTGGTAGQGMSDTGTLAPFGGVRIADPDDTSLTVTVGFVSGGGGGSFTAVSSSGWAASGLPGATTTYTRTFAGGTLSAAMAQSALRALVFQASPYAQPPGTVAGTGFTVTVADGLGSSATDAAAGVAVTSVHDLPSVAGGVSGQGLFDSATLAPFAAVTIADPDDTSLALTVTLAGSGAGSLTAASAAGWTASGVGGTTTTYTRTFAQGTLSATDAQAALRALVFQSAPYTQPPGTVATTVLAVTATDVLGGSASGTASVGVTASAAPPSALALAGGSDSGVAGDDLTSVSDPTITGSGVPGDVVTLFDGTTALGTVTVSAAGTWSLATGTLADGPHTLTASETCGDGTVAGEVSAASPPLVLAIDTTPPAAPAALGLAPASDSGVRGDDLTSDPTPTITGTGLYLDTVALYEGTTLLGTASVPLSGTWSVATALVPGAHVLDATQADAAGNVSAPSAAATVTIATTAAAPTLADTSLGSPTAAPVLAGTSPGGGSVTILDGATPVGIATVSASGTYGFGFAAALGAGTHTLTAVATDVVGNVSPASAPVLVTVATDGSYSVVTPGGATPTTVRLYGATGTLGEVDGISAQGQVLERVTATAAVLQIYDAAGTLIGTVTQPAAGFAMQPLLATQARAAAATSAVGTTGSLVALLSEANVITTRGADTLTGGAGADTVFAAGPSTSVLGGSGSLLLVQGMGAATLAGGTGSATVYGGSATGAFTGGSAGGNVLLAGTGNATLIGGGPGDVLAAGSGQTVIVMQASSLGFGGLGAATIDGATGGLLVAGSGSTVLVAGAGPETLYGGTGSATLFGGSGPDVLSAGPAGQTVMIGGSQATTFLGAAGAATVQGGTGNDTVFAGSGSMLIVEGGGADVVLLGSGASTITGGQGADVYALVSGLGGGSATISGFKVGTDQVALTGYDLSAVGTQTTAGGTMLSLADGTRITLLGVGQLASGSVV